MGIANQAGHKRKIKQDTSRTQAENPAGHKHMGILKGGGWGGGHKALCGLVPQCALCPISGMASIKQDTSRIPAGHKHMGILKGGGWGRAQGSLRPRAAMCLVPD